LGHSKSKLLLLLACSTRIRIEKDSSPDFRIPEAPVKKISVNNAGHVVEWPELKYSLERNASFWLDAKLQGSTFIREFQTHHSDVKTVALVGAENFGIALVIISHTICDSNASGRLKINPLYRSLTNRRRRLALSPVCVN